MKTLLTSLAALAATGLAVAQTAPAYLDYVAEYAPLAVSEMHASGIPASITLAQGLLESAAGQSTLARKGNNHFGIKCHSAWDGQRMYRKDDDRDRRGRLVESCFRRYDDPAESYADHSAFLTGSPRYASLFLLRPDDYKGWARGLKKAGYATSRTYADKLIGIIENYELHRYDDASAAQVLLAQTRTPGDAPPPDAVASAAPGRPALTGAARRIRQAPAERTAAPPRRTSSTAAASAEHAVRLANDVKYTVPLPGETLLDVAKRTKRFTSDLASYNETLQAGDAPLASGQRIYLQPKRKSYRGRAKRHVVEPGEDMQAVADRYGLRTDALLERNRMREGQQPAPGEFLQLRGRRPRSNDVRLARRSRVASANAEPARTPAKPTATAPIPRSEGARTRAFPREQYDRDGRHVGGASARAEAPASSKATSPRPAPTTPTARPVAPPTPRTLTVRRGDTLWAISRRAGVSVAELRALNALDGDTIHVGQELVVAR